MHDQFFLPFNIQVMGTGQLVPSSSGCPVLINITIFLSVYYMYKSDVLVYPNSLSELHNVKHCQRIILFSEFI